MELIEKDVGYFYSFDGTKIYYECRGKGPPVVFIYGIACLINHWHHQIQYFNKNYTVITFDIRGHHQSAEVVNSQNMNISSIANDVVCLLNHLGIKRAHLVGHSFGAPILLDFYKSHRERTLSLVLINGFSKNPVKNMFGLNMVEPLFYFIKAQFLKAPDLWRALWKSLVHNPIAIYGAAFAGGFNLHLTQLKDIEVYVKGVAHMNLEYFLPLFESLMSFNGDEILTTIDCPTLIVSGEMDRVTPRSYQFLLHESIKNSELLLMPYGSHCCQLDFPEFINLRLEQFFERASLNSSVLENSSEAKRASPHR